MSENPELDYPNPIFVGGVGRSGTHPMGRLVNATNRYWQIRTEARFHVSRGGMADLFYDRITMEAFLNKMHGFFWERGHPAPQGLFKVISPEGLDAALAKFESGFAEDRVVASRELIQDLFDPYAKENGKPSWVELTAEVIEEAPFLLELFPNAKFFNMVRDGRVVAAGAVRKLLNMTDDPVQALDRWEKTVQKSHEAMARVPDDRILTVVLEDLTALDRERTFERVVEFLDIDEGNERRMRKYFDAHISGERANVGRWRQRMSPADVRLVDRRYRKIIRRLHRDGIDWIPDPEPRRTVGRLLRRPQPSPAS